MGLLVLPAIVKLHVSCMQQFSRVMMVLLAA
jgi:hypothetical protein